MNRGREDGRAVPLASPAQEGEKPVLLRGCERKCEREMRRDENRSLTPRFFDFSFRFSHDAVSVSFALILEARLLLPLAIEIFTRNIFSHIFSRI